MGFSNPSKEEDNVESFFPAERQQRLDLILHLIPNTRQIILLRGPEQSGKSFFLRQFKKQIDDSWQFCQLSAEDLMRTDTPLQVLADAFDELEGSNKQLLVRLAGASKAEKKIIICIEDTHKLDVARFDFLFQLIDSYECLHIILTSSDNLGEAVESRCQLVDLEPFTQQQTTQYAKKRVYKSSLDLVNLAGLDDVVLFIETGGLPGRINDVLEQMNRQPVKQRTFKPMESVPFAGMIGFAILVTAVLIFSFYPSPDSDTKPPEGLSAEQYTVKKTQTLVTLSAMPDPEEKTVVKDVGPSTQALNSKPPSTQEMLSPQRVEANVATSPENTKKEIIEAEVENREKMPKAEAVNIELEKGVIAEEVIEEIKEKTPKVNPVIKELTEVEQNHVWVQTRDDEHFTLQLLGVSTEEAAKAFLLKHKTIKPLYFFQNKRNGGKWFSVIYGDFENMESASQHIKKMPATLSKFKPWIRQFKAIQGDLFIKK